ncbi:MAG: toll/interleukin-1 receptor domain-containing protein [Gammaproteobacteria bacterium]|nr:toll/interleukin-1 receptor domain-containing protein [Gammaproteobacteria bacterium]
MDSAAWLWPLIAASIVAVLALWHWIHTQKLRTIFVSYRRSDSAEETAQIVGALARHFGAGRVFHDVTSIRPGDDFRLAISRTLRRCDAALVVIGPTWTDCQDEAGARRLLQDHDVVRMEVATALESGALVVPMLVGGAEMPKAEALPDNLKRLRDRNAVTLSADHRTALTARLAPAVRAAPLRRSPLFLGLCHLDVAFLLLVFFLVGGMTAVEFSTALGIVLPALAAVLSVAVWQRWGTSRPPIRSLRVSPAAVLIPLLFVALIAALVAMKSLNWGIASFETFKLALVITEILFAGYTGIALASMQTEQEAT